jgi:thiol:disulfide interchange protein
VWDAIAEDTFLRRKACPVHDGDGCDCRVGKQIAREKLMSGFGFFRVTPVRSWTAWMAITSALAGFGAGAQIIHPVPAANSKHIYSETADPKADIAAALQKARLEHKRVILDFGGDWCPDCQVLDIYFHQSPNADLLENNFVLVHVWIGQEDKHLDVAHKYGVPVTNGVPGLAVLRANGSLVYSQGTGQFRDMRSMDPASVTAFLKKWKI